MNFLIEGSVGIRFEGKHFDLHSFFSIDKFIVNPGEGAVILEFVPIGDFKNESHNVKILGLQFSMISYLEFSPSFCANASDSLEEFGFKAPWDRDDNWLKTFEQSNAGDHLFIRLSSLEFFRIQCAEICVFLNRDRHKLG
ncbi:hypothetical protein [Frateuria sp. STR12]|uniref:hypothetical protein n=1 Tax=Frateuria hangzhouensis TaxID=2995589 RepID=UPI002260CBB1|nr:hypothetical protein [Frateuria sp. STR12]MCX7512678.1 hypothetical protein [Frateuria sp. STR12]